MTSDKTEIYLKVSNLADPPVRFMARDLLKEAKMSENLTSLASLTDKKPELWDSASDGLSTQSCSSSVWFNDSVDKSSLQRVGSSNLVYSRLLSSGKVENLFFFRPA